jgi:signal transduction histidine kinase/CheY-like chemotaxis protein
MARHVASGPAAETPARPDRGDSPDSSNTLVWLRAVIALAVVLPAIMFVAAAGYLRHQALAEAQTRLNSSVRIASEHVLKVLETNVVLLNRVADALGNEPDLQLSARELLLHTQLQRMANSLPQLQGIFVIGADGRLIVTNRAYPAPRQLDFSDRAWFVHHRGGGAQPYFSDVLTSRTTGEPFFDMSLRRSRADGTFAGTLSASMAPAYFSRVYGELAGQDTALNIALLRSDGAVLARWPQPPSASDRPGSEPVRISLPEPYASDAANPATPTRLPDGREGLRAQRSLKPYPLTLTAWTDLPAVLSGWYRQLMLLAALTFPTALGLAYITRVAMQRTQRALQFSRELVEQTTTRKRLEESLLQAQKLEAMGRLTGGVAHDFNNLLMTISNNLYLLKRLTPEAADSSQLAAIDRAVVAGSTLTRQLLSFSRRQVLVAERVDLAQRLPLMIDMLKPTLGSAVRIEVAVDAGLPAIEVDAAELELALLNLALNARDAMPKGGCLRISAAAWRAEDGPHIGRESAPRPAAARQAPRGGMSKVAESYLLMSVCVAVTDTGAGIPPAMLERVFEPFFTTKPVGQGTGLGLAQVYGFCQRASGAAYIESRPGAGTTVRLCFPAARSSEAPPAAATADNHDPLVGIRVLLAEDNPGVAGATAEVLGAMGCSVEHVDSADAALARIASAADRIDVLISDVVMPGALDGIDLATRARALRPALAVIVMSGYSASLERAAGLQLELLPKPCAPPTLAAAILSALDRARMSVTEAGSGVRAAAG